VAVVVVEVTHRGLTVQAVAVLVGTARIEQVIRLVVDHLLKQ
jgi:hypothetical protein